MKNILTPLASLLFFLCSTFVTAQVNLTLNVDMTYQSVSESGVHVAGSFQGWNPSSTQLTDDDGDNIYSVTISVDANSSHEYKFLNGNYWGADEQVWGDCGAGNGNRTITLGDSDLSETAYYFGSCDFAIPAVTGCTDGSACNYFSDATEDDGSCQYAAEGYDCDGNEVCNYASVDYVGLTGSNESDGIYYLDFESYSPVGTSTDGYTAHIVVNGESSPIDYNFPLDNNNNSWYVGIPVTPGSVYTWSATIETCGGGITIEGEFSYDVYGCTDNTANNYNEGANVDDESCEYTILGCTNDLACNWDVEVNTDDGSCEYAPEGYDCEGNELCLYASVDYLENVNSSESNGIYYLDFESWSLGGSSTEGYTAQIVVNGESSPIDYNFPLDNNNNSWYVGIPVTPGSVYSWSATIETCGGGQTIEGEYTSPIYGCTGPDHCNYDPEATMDDGSCIYAAEGFDCAGNCLSGELLSMYDSWGDGWNGATLTINNVDYTVEGSSASVCVNNLLDCNLIQWTSGTYDDETSWTLGDIASGEAGSGAGTYGDCGVVGCMNASACNYNVDATTDDGSCTFAADGFDCEGNCLSGELLTMDDSFGDGWNGAVLTINGVDYTVEEDNFTAVACIDLLSCNSVSWTEGAWDDETSWSFGDMSGEDGVTNIFDGLGTGFFGEGCIPGCMNQSACNYDDAANVDDGSCEFGAPIDYFGLTGSNESDGVYYLDFESYSNWGTSTDGYTATIIVNEESSSINYNYVVDNNNAWYVGIPVIPGNLYSWSATIETCGGSQTIEGEYTSPLFGCMDQNALNYNETATNDDGSCNYPVCQTIDIPEGWSIFSTYIIPQIDSFDEVLLPIVDNIEIIKDFEGTAYIPDYDFNGIGTLSIGQGYQSKLYAPSSIDVCGEYASPEFTPIYLAEGWNMIGYLRLDPAPADLVLQQIASDGNLVIAKDYLGLAYLPEWNFNAIGDMQPTQGYQLKVSDADILLYLSNDNSYRMSAIEVTENNVSHYAKVAATDNNMTVVIEDAAWDILPTEGAEIAAFDKDANMVGSAIYSSPVTVVTVWGDDATTVSKDGMLVTELVSFKVWNTNEVSDFTVSKWIEGSSSYQVNGISVASTIETNNVITELNTSERVLVKVINVLGQEVNMDDESFKGTVLFNVYDDGFVERFIK